MKIAVLYILLLCCFMEPVAAQKQLAIIECPSKKIKVTVELSPLGEVRYAVTYDNDPVLSSSQLGLVRNDGDFSKALSFISASTVKAVLDKYEILTAKKKNCTYQANNRVLHFVNKEKQLLDIIFQVSDDGVALRYFFPGKSPDAKTITGEKTSFHFPAAATAWLQPMQESKSGWEKTNPAYEEHYQQNIPVGTKSPTNAGWVYPALFNTNNIWVLITEAGMDGNYCATRLKPESPNGEYFVGFPDPKEVMDTNSVAGLLPQAALPFYSPWRVITIGGLNTITQSTLGTDLAKPAIAIDKSFIRPGKSSWSWIMSKDDSIVYSEQRRYVDLAADMHWQYCLVDADWDRKIGYEKIKELADYAKTKNVGLLLWYNSSGDWNTTKYTPKSKLVTQEGRVKEFARLKEIGIKGVKIDFFAGDGQSVIKYYLDILKDAAQAGLLTNFHGATLPRGWNRTYPNLMTTEAVRGFEMITFTQNDANAEPSHCAMLPFTRNAFDPMDFTPMNLYKIPTRVRRRTTSGFELALSVLFVSGIQHYAESPEGMTHVPADVKNFLRDVPLVWEDVKFIDGYPGKYAVIARKAGNKWYIAAINGENQQKSVSLNLSLFNKKKATLIADDDTAMFSVQHWSMNTTDSTRQIDIKAYGGFIIVLE